MTGVDPDEGDGALMQTLSTVVFGDADEEEATAFREQWHGRVQRILDVSPEGGPITVETVE